MLRSEHHDAGHMTVQDIDRGWQAIKREVEKAQGQTVAVGILSGASNDGVSIAEYATYNEYGTKHIPSRPFMAISFDEGRAEIDADFKRQTDALVTGKATANAALTIIGQKHVTRIKKTITGRNIPPPLSPQTVARKKGSSKTLVDTGAMVNAVQIELRNK